MAMSIQWFTWLGSQDMAKSMAMWRLSRSWWVRLERPYLRVESRIPSRVDRISAALCSRKVVRLQSLVLCM